MSGRARSTSTLTTLAITFCPATTSTTNTSIMRTEGRRSCDRATAAATTMTTTVLPSCVIARNTDVEKSVAFVAPHVARPRSTRAGPACARTTQERTPTATAPTTTAASATVRRSPVVTCGSTRARTNVRTVAWASTSRRTTAVVARGDAGIGRRPAENRGRDGGARGQRHHQEDQDDHDERFAKRSIGETQMYANPVDGSGRRWGGFAANPGSPFIATHVRDRRDRFDPEPGGTAEHLAERLDGHRPPVVAALMTFVALPRTEHRDDRSR